jgi:hypothetical protein
MDYLPKIGKAVVVLGATALFSVVCKNVYTSYTENEPDSKDAVVAKEETALVDSENNGRMLSTFEDELNQIEIYDDNRSLEEMMKDGDIKPCDAAREKFQDYPEIEIIYFAGNCYVETDVVANPRATYYGLGFPKGYTELVREDEHGFQCSSVANQYKVNGIRVGSEIFDTTLPMIAVGEKLLNRFPLESVVKLEYEKDGETHTTYAFVKDTGPWWRKDLSHLSKKERIKKAKEIAGNGRAKFNKKGVLYYGSNKIDLSAYVADHYRIKANRKSNGKVKMTKLQIVESERNLPNFVNLGCTVPIKGNNRPIYAYVSNEIHVHRTLFENESWYRTFLKLHAEKRELKGKHLKKYEKKKKERERRLEKKKRRQKRLEARKKRLEEKKKRRKKKRH